MGTRGAIVESLICAKCSRELAAGEAGMTCPDCGIEGILDVRYDYDAMAGALSREDLERSRENSLWRYLPLLPVSDATKLPPLRTGWTPLVSAPGVLGLDRLYIKDESPNPTASLKDRATAVAMARALDENVGAVAAASTGNAGCSLAGFAAATGLPCFIFVPRSAPRPKVAQLLVYGATVFAVDGSYDDAFELATEAIQRFGWYNRCCAVNPFLVEGKKTVAFEICEALRFGVPDKVFVPVGDGCIMSGTYKGFYEFMRLGLTRRVPKLIGVQAEGCQPVKRAFDGRCDVEPCEACTLADSIAVGHPRNWRKAVKAVRASEGEMITVTDDEITAAIGDLARATGIYGEPAGVTAFAGLRKAVERGEVGRRETVVVLMTGSGLKDTESALRAAGAPIEIGRSIEDVEHALSGSGQGRT